MKRVLAMLAAVVIVAGAVGFAKAEDRMDIVMDAGRGCVKILKDICKEYSENGKLDDETVYIAAIYYEFYLEMHRVWLSESMLERDKNIDTGKEVLASSRKLFDAFDDILAHWIETKDPEYAEGIMNIIKREFGSK